ncbi:hypothetical protein ACFQ6U_09555 [Streptomyces sp. NPDC056465]|uniref:hypothetical protein n=1 Tax=Streptomyces sp. NPDC056465 TaxID=3345829 RepID=UPI0036BC62F1
MSVFFTRIKTAEIDGWLYEEGGVSVRRVGRTVVEDVRAGDEVAEVGAAAVARDRGACGDVAAAGADLHAEAAGDGFVDVALDEEVGDASRVPVLPSGRAP